MTPTLTPRRFRCSRLPLLFQCARSADPGLQVEGADREPANLGTGAHEFLAASINRGEPAWDLVPDIAAGLQLDRDDLARQCGLAWARWKEVEPVFPGAQTEVPLKFEDAEAGLTLTGTADILSPPSSLGLPEVRIGDAKTGWLDGDHDDQLRGYGFLAAWRYDEAERVYVAVLRTRDGQGHGRYYTRAELWQWYAGLLERTRDQVFRPGRHCGYCSRGPTCEAKTALLQQSLDMVRARHGDALPDDPTERADTLQKLLEAARLVDRAAKDAVAMVRAEVLAAGGQLGDLEIVRHNEREIVFPKALPVLLEAVGNDRLAEILRVSNGDAEKAVKAAAPTKPRGSKGKAVKELYSRLEEAGALRVDTVERLEVRRPAKALANEEAGE